MKKFISFALAASMALSMVPATAFATSDLTTSHSNIRVTSNTEFKPSDKDKKDIPYIILEASNDFLNEKQTFELALENAEWLEMDSDNPSDPDKRYVEDEDVMAEFLEFSPADKSSSTTGGTTGGTTTTTKTFGELEKAYRNAADDLEDAAAKYTAPDTTTPGALKDAKDNYDAASAIYNGNSTVTGSQAYTQKYKDIYDAVSAAAANVDALVSAYETEYAKTSDPRYLSAVSNPTEPEDAASYALADSTNPLQSKYYVYTEEADGKTAGEPFVAEANLATELEAAHKAGKVELNPTGQGVADRHTTWQTNQDFKDEVDQKVADARKDLADIGATIDSKDPSKVVTTGVDKKVADAKDDYDKAAIEEAAAKREYDSTKKIYDDLYNAAADSTTTNAAAKAKFEAALKARNAAGIEFINGYGSQALESIGIYDKSKTYTDSNGVYTTKGIVGFDINGLKKDDDTTATEKEKSAVADAYTFSNKLKVDITQKSDTRIIVETDGYKFKDGDVLRIPLFVRTTGGVASVSIDSLDSEFTSEGKTFARTADGDTNLTIEKTQSFYDGDEVKNIYLEELVPGTIDDDGTISLRVNGDFKLKASNKFKIERITGNGLDQDLTNSVYTDGKCTDAFNVGDSSDEIYIEMGGSKSTQAAQYRISGLLILEDGADFGDEATLTVSGGGTTKQTVTIGTYEDYGVKLTAEDKDLPVVYAGTKASSKYDNQTLKVTIEETVANSFIDNRKMELTLPDGVKFADDNGEATALGDIDEITEDFKIYNFKGSLDDVKSAFDVNADGTKITITGKELGEAFESSGNNKDRKRKIEFSVHVTAEADFTGDVVLTLNGPAVANQEVSATIATVKAPIEVKTTVNELKIDYRNTDIADITLIEPEAGLWAKDDVICVEGEKMSFESDAKAEVVSGDMKLKKGNGNGVDTFDNGDRYDNNDVLFIEVDSRSSKTPAEIKLSNLSLYMDRSLAAGDYKLKVFGAADNEFFMNNYDGYYSDSKVKEGDYTNVFDTQKVTVMNDFVKVVTAGREVDDATFTTTIVVPIGSDTITAGTREIKLSEMQGGACPAAYINNDGYTMLPVRAVTEALNSVASVRWDDATKTCTIGFGQRVFSMTVGSKVLNMNGVTTPLNAAPEIRDGRVFLPLRDLGYALGLSENKISWDATTQTAKLN